MQWHFIVGEGGDLVWRCRPFPIETPQESVLGDEECFEASWKVLKRFTFQGDDDADDAGRRLCLDAKVERRER